MSPSSSSSREWAGAGECEGRAPVLILLPVPRRAGRWISAPNQAPPFNGTSPHARMVAGNVSDLYVVRQYLDAQLV